MNSVSATDVTLLSLALGSFTAVAPALQGHDYYVAGGFAVLGVLLVYLYHKFGTSNTTPPAA